MFPSRDPEADGPGDLIRIEVSSGGSCVQARSAAFADRDTTPRWADLGAPACFASAVPYQGLATPGSRGGAEARGGYFFGTRREGPGHLGEVGAGDFTGVVAEARDGTAHDAAALLVDSSAP